MQYELEIIDFDKDVRGFKIGTCDVKVKYSEEKWEIFRNLGIFYKENKKWISFPKTKKGEKWVALYERNPPIDQGMLPKLLSELEDKFL